MPYIVYTGGSEGFREADNLDHAMDLAAWALLQADDFARRMGWAPFWADGVEIRKIAQKPWRVLRNPFTGYRNPDSVAENSIQTHDAATIRKRLKMPPCPAARPSYA